jgi:hypothetical protein
MHVLTVVALVLSVSALACAAAVTDANRADLVGEVRQTDVSVRRNSSLGGTSRVRGRRFA